MRVTLNNVPGNLRLYPKLCTNIDIYEDGDYEDEQQSDNNVLMLINNLHIYDTNI